MEFLQYNQRMNFRHVGIWWLSWRLTRCLKHLDWSCGLKIKGLLKCSSGSLGIQEPLLFMNEIRFVWNSLPEKFEFETMLVLFASFVCILATNQRFLRKYFESIVYLFTSIMASRVCPSRFLSCSTRWVTCLHEENSI